MTRELWGREIGLFLAWALNTLAASVLGWSAIALPARFTGRAFEELRESLTVAGWGALLVAYGVVLLACIRAPARVTRCVFVAGSVLYLALAIYFAASAKSDPLVSPWGLTMFVLVGGWQLTQSEAYRQGALRARAAQ